MSDEKLAMTPATLRDYARQLREVAITMDAVAKGIEQRGQQSIDLRVKSFVRNMKRILQFRGQLIRAEGVAHLEWTIKAMNIEENN